MVHHLEENREEITQDKGSGPSLRSPVHDSPPLQLTLHLLRRKERRLIKFSVKHRSTPRIYISIPWFTACWRRLRRLFRSGGGGGEVRPSVEIFSSWSVHGQSLPGREIFRLEVQANCRDLQLTNQHMEENRDEIFRLGV
jgi:hypothetical protein